MKDILIIFAILLLLLITISTLGGSLSFVGNNNGRNEFFTDSNDTVPIPKPLSLKQPFSQPVPKKPTNIPLKPASKAATPTTAPESIEGFEGPMYATA